MIHPALHRYIESLRQSPPPHPSTMTLDERRTHYREATRAWWPEPHPVEVRDLSIDLVDRRLAARLYVPTDDEGRALIVYFHGGSFVVGDLDSHDGLCRRLASDARVRLLAVDYRRAPENPFPAAIDDAVDVVRYLAAHRGDVAQHDAALVVMGDSAGATIATVAASLIGREVGLAAQVLLYPTLGPEMLTDSAHVYATGYGIELDHLRYDYGLYLAGQVDHTDPRVSPLMNEDLTGAPPAIIVVAQCDPLRDEAVAYAGLLEHFDVPVTLLEAEGMVHGFIRLGGTIPQALAIVDDVAEHLHRRIAERA